MYAVACDVTASLSVDVSMLVMLEEASQRLLQCLAWAPLADHIVECSCSERDTVFHC